jgi:hypothetical protein
VRKLFVAAIAAAVALAGFTVFATADQGQQGTSWTFSFSNKKKAKPTGSTSIIEPAKRDTKGTDDPSDDHYDAPTVSVIKFPKGSSIDTGARKRCKTSPSAVQSGAGSCPGKTKIGSGLANSLLGQPDEGGGTPIVAPIEAFNLKKGIMFVVDPCSPGTGPGTGTACSPFPGGRVVLVGTWSKVLTRPTLRVPTPDSLQRGGVIITRFELTTDKHTKKVIRKIDGRKRAVVLSYATTPGVCKGKWKSQAVESYADGSKQTIPDSMTCRKG